VTLLWLCVRTLEQCLSLKLAKLNDNNVYTFSSA